MELDIPACLVLTDEQRKEAWVGRKVTKPKAFIAKDKTYEAWKREQKRKQAIRLADLRERKRLERRP